MRKTLLILIIIPVLSINILGQKPILDYQNAVIIKKNNDSVSCKIQMIQVSEKELDPMGEIIVNYKVDGNPEIQSMKTKEIQSIKLSYCTYLNVPVDKQEYLFKVVVNGRVSLLEYPRISIMMVGGREKFGPKEIKYSALRTNDKTVIIKQKKDISAFNDIIENCPKAKEIVSNKSFKIDNLDLLVTQLNNCK